MYTTRVEVVQTKKNVTITIHLYLIYQNLLEEKIARNGCVFVSKAKIKLLTPHKLNRLVKRFFETDKFGIDCKKNFFGTDKFGKF